jgi:hypothetical protein
LVAMGVWEVSTHEWDGHGIFFSSCTISSHVSYDLFQGQVSLQSNKTTSKSNLFSSSTVCQHHRAPLNVRRQDVVEVIVMKMVSMEEDVEGWCWFGS